MGVEPIRDLLSLKVIKSRMRNYFILCYTFLLFIGYWLILIAMLPFAYILYPLVYPFRNTWVRRCTPFWLLFNDSSDGDFGDPKWQAVQAYPQTRWQWFVLSYKWNVIRNPIWNYTGRVWYTGDREFNSPVTLKCTNPKITARYSAAIHRGDYGYGLFLFKVGNLDRFVFSTLFKVGKHSIVFKVGFNEFRPMSKLAICLNTNIGKLFF